MEPCKKKSLNNSSSELQFQFPLYDFNKKNPLWAGIYFMLRARI